MSAESGASEPAVAPPAQISSSSAVVAAARQHKFGIGITSAIVILLVVAAAYGVYAFLSRTRPVPFQNFSVNKITETGKARLVAISPDGKYILNVLEANGRESLWLRNVPTNSNTQVMPPEPLQYFGLQFSPDGNYLYFVRGEQGQSLKFLIVHQSWAALRKSSSPMSTRTSRFLPTAAVLHMSFTTTRNWASSGW